MILLKVTEFVLGWLSLVFENPNQVPILTEHFSGVCLFFQNVEFQILYLSLTKLSNKSNSSQYLPTTQLLVSLQPFHNFTYKIKSLHVSIKAQTSKVHQIFSKFTTTTVLRPRSISYSTQYTSTSMYDKEVNVLLRSMICFVVYVFLYTVCKLEYSIVSKPSCCCEENPQSDGEGRDRGNSFANTQAIARKNQFIQT